MKRKINQAVILCGGKGTRLGNITKTTPKPLIKFGKKSFIDILIENLSRFNFSEIILLTSYKHQLFKKKYHKKKIHNSEILCLEEKSPLGTGGAIINSYKHLNESFLLINGDTFLNFNYINFIKIFEKSNTDASICLVKTKNKKFGGVKIKEKTIVSISKNNKSEKYVNGGVYIFKKKFFKLFEKNKIYSLENDCLPLLIKKKRLSYFQLNNSNDFIDIGTPEDLKKAKKIFKNYKRPAVLLDRDGVVNEDLGYVHHHKNFFWKKNIIKLIKYFNKKNYFIFVISNQSGIGRGYYSFKDLKKLENWIRGELYGENAFIDDFFYAPYFKESRKYSSKYHELLRKPNTGMIKLIENKWSVDKTKYILFGDQKSDIKLGKKISAKSFLVKENSDIFKIIKEKKL